MENVTKILTWNYKIENTVHFQIKIKKFVFEKGQETKQSNVYNKSFALKFLISVRAIQTKNAILKLPRHLNFKISVRPIKSSIGLQTRSSEFA